MYHFTVTENAPDAISLDEYNEVAGYAVRYLKEFQISAVRFLYNHINKREFCILNDESGLGKTVTAGVFLGIVAAKMNCLIVVDNCDDLVSSWLFHLDVLTDLKTHVLTEPKEYDAREYAVYIVKWNTLRTIVDLNKMKFDLIILDNRGQILNNTFCTSTLLKEFEKKVQIVISSVDITSDVKLMHNVLRLGGRLEHNLQSFKNFEEKFKLPDLKEISNKKSDLEDYFLRREVLINYCRDFRLRRYRHQFEISLPLVDEQRFKVFLQEWKEASKTAPKKNNEIVINDSMPWQIDTEEFLKAFDPPPHESHQSSSQSTTISFTNDKNTSQQQSRGTSVDVTDDQMDMSPLIFHTDSEDEPDVIFVSSDSRDEGKNVVIEIDCAESIDAESVSSDGGVDVVSITESKTLENSVNESKKKPIGNAQKNSVKKANSKSESATKLKGNSIDTPRTTRAMQRLNAETLKKAKRETRNNKVLPVTNQTKNIGTRTPKPKSNVNEKKSPDIKREKLTPKKCETVSTPRKTNVKSAKKALEEEKKDVVNEDIIKKPEKPNKSSPKTPEIINDLKKSDTPATPTTSTKITAKTKSPTEEKENRNSKRKTQRKSQTPMSKAQIETRTMQRKTRSAGGEQKYFALEYETKKKLKAKKSQEKKLQNSKSPNVKSKENSKSLASSPGSTEVSTKSKTINNKTKKELKTQNTKTKTPTTTKTTTTTKATTSTGKVHSTQMETNLSVNSTQTSILPTLSDYEEIPCGQKLQFDTCSENSLQRLGNTSEFAMPATPPSLRAISHIPLYQRQSTPRPMFLDSECDIAILSSMNVNNSNNVGKTIVVLSSSQDDASLSSQTSLEMEEQRKRKRYSKRLSTVHPTNKTNNSKKKSQTASFGNIQGSQRNNIISPDLFSTGSEAGGGSNSNILTLSQQPSRRTLPSRNPSPFGFKIFGSEVRRTQTPTTPSTDSITRTSRSGHSCLNILEEMFEKDTAKSDKKANIQKGTTLTRKRTMNNIDIQNTAQNSTTKALAAPRKPIHNSLNEQSNESEDFFEITKNSTFSNTLRINSNGNISPVQQLSNSQHHNKITNYLIGNGNNNVNGNGKLINGFVDEYQMFGTPKKKTQQQQAQQGGSGGSNNVNNGALRKSPKSVKGTQTTKLTKWFRRSSIDGTTTNRSQTANRNDSNEKKTIKRRRLDLSFKN